MAYSGELTAELSFGFNNYAFSVNGDRAIPDVKCGLKPVARRILYGANVGGYSSSKSYEKCARLVGDVMGNLHPHGDSSIYGAMVHMSQPWVMRYPLMDFYGNMGNIDGDGPAAYRYTNIRLAKISEEGMLAGLKKRNVDFIPDYDEKGEEPVTLPAIFPNLLCNPNVGIGVAMACSWLPHNLKEVGAAIFDYLDGNEPKLPGPDFPTGGLIINGADLPNIIKEGRGTVKVRARYKVEKNNLVFYEIPYGTTTEAILDEIGAVCDEQKIDGITEVRNESNKHGIRLVVHCRKDVSPDTIAMKLYAETSLQTSISYNQVALVDKTPTELGLKDCIKHYVNHNIDCLKRETSFDLKKAQDRQPIVEGLLKALNNINDVINIIRTSSSAADAKANLINKYGFSEVQAKAILDMKLAKLAHLEKVELEDEYTELTNKIKEYTNILASEALQAEELKKRLKNIIDKFGDDRRTEITNISIGKKEKEIETVVAEDCVVVLTRLGNIKRIPKSSFKIQKRNGKGVKTADDAILSLVSTNTIDNLLIFTSMGKMYRLLVDNVPVGTNVSRGVNISTLIPNLGNGESVIAAASLDRENEFNNVVFITKQGMIKKTSLSEYKSIKRNAGTVAIKLKEDDSIANVEFMNEEDLVLVTKNGMGIHFETSDIAPIGRNTAGVKSIKLAENDYVITGIPIRDKKTSIGLFSENGYGKKLAIEDIPIQGRVGKGVIVYKNLGGAGVVSAATGLHDGDSVMILGDGNTICIEAKDVPLLSRVGQGNLMIKGKIKSAVRL